MENVVGTCAECGATIVEEDNVFGDPDVYKCPDCGAYNDIEPEE